MNILHLMVVILLCPPDVAQDHLRAAGSSRAGGAPGPLPPTSGRDSALHPLLCLQHWRYALRHQGVDETEGVHARLRTPCFKD